MESSLPALFQAGTSTEKTCENVRWVGWGFMGITDKNSEVTILLKCQFFKVWGADFALPGKAAKAYKYNVQPVAENFSEADMNTQNLSQVRHRLFTGW